ncbi:hypothetical protein CBR_g29359 [Chara braunii]|uniref:Uncharacterized protein n=1 Tax=Chara braunii TaxID=69332 RepID=A0A388JWK2_CHABU|nr:hypothetical protein CBR_g29359 [Chara braunii]|eukprot:GBG62160.1 hypothetical protein CBR_g29359 [Chara braunii]
MSFSTEQVISERLMVPGGAFSAIRQVRHPRLSPDLLRFAAFFSMAAIHTATEFQFGQSGVARVLAEASAFLRLSPPGESHVSVVVVFSCNLSTLHPARHTAILRQLRDWALSLTVEWVRLLAWPRDHVVTMNDIDLQLCFSSTAPEWRQAYVALSFCLLEIAFHWVEPSDRSAEDEIPDDEVELLLRMDTEGDFLGIIFGEVRDDHLSSITDELLVFLTQVLNDLPLEILSHCDERSGIAALVRTLEPHLLWSTCTELEGNGYYLPSRGAYLIVDVTDHSTWDPLIRHVPIGETNEEADEEEEESEEGDHLQYTEGGTTPEEEESGAKSGDPDYGESEDAESEGASSGRVESREKEGESGELSGPDELSREEREAVAQRVRAAAEGKRPIEGSDGPPPMQDDPTHNPEPPREEDEQDDPTAEGSRSRRRRGSRSPSQFSPARPTALCLRRDAGARASYPVIIPPSP